MARKPKATEQEQPPEAEHLVTLHAADRQKVEALFSLGRQGLYDLGMDDAAIDAFVERRDVIAYATTLNQEFVDQRNLAARRKFGVMRTLGRMAPAATGVLATALNGPEYQKDEEGNYVFGRRGFVKLTPEPTSVQMAAAAQVLDRLGITPKERTTHVDISVKQVLYGGRAVAIVDQDPEQKTEEDRAQAREAVRAALERALQPGGLLDKLKREFGDTVSKSDGVTKNAVTARKYRRRKKGM